MAVKGNIADLISRDDLQRFSADVPWEKVFSRPGEVRRFEQSILPSFMKRCRWFGGKAKVIKNISINKVLPLKVDKATHFLVIVEVQYVRRLPEFYFIPLTWKSTIEKNTEESTLQSVVCQATFRNKHGWIVDSCYDPAFRNFLFLKIAGNHRIKINGGVLEFNISTRSTIKASRVTSRLLKADSTNTAFIYNDKYFFKFYRKIEKEINPDLEIVRFLSEKTNFTNSPRYAGSIEYRDQSVKTLVFGLLQEKVENLGDAWHMSINSVGRCYDYVLEHLRKTKPPRLLDKPAICLEEAPELIQDLIGRKFYTNVVQLGYRTAEMHMALASDRTNPEFAPEYFTKEYQRSLHVSSRKVVRDRFKMLRQSMSKLNAETRVVAQRVLQLENCVLQCISEVYTMPIHAIKTRIHGDFHLGQVLFTGKDFFIIDFEGEPGFNFSERRLKKSPLKDVAGMMRSFHYAAFGKILLHERYGQQDKETLEAWAEQWQHYVSRFYLGAYMKRMNMAELSMENDVLIRTYLLEKAVYELGYELNGRPAWTIIPLRGIEYQLNRYLREKESRKPMTVEAI